MKPCFPTSLPSSIQTPVVLESQARPNLLRNLPCPPLSEDSPLLFVWPASQYIKEEVKQFRKSFSLL